MSSKVIVTILESSRGVLDPKQFFGVPLQIRCVLCLLAPLLLGQRFLHEESLMPLRIVIECAEDLIPQGLIKGPGLKAECIEMRSGAAALFGRVLHGGYQ